MNCTDDQFLECLAEAAQISYRFDLGAPLTYRRLQQLFEQLCLVARLNPKNLLISEKDHEPLLNWVALCTNIRVPVDPGLLPGTQRLVHLLNETTGTLLNVATTRSLEPGSVIVRFFG